MIATSVKRHLFPRAFLVFVPLSVWFGLSHFNLVAALIITILAIIPLTYYMAKATQQLSTKTGTIVSSLLNATFGNAIEFMICLFALKAGLMEMVKASITGSIILNILLLIGLAMLFGGIKYREQTFNQDSAGIASTMLLIAVTGLSLPTIYSVITGKSAMIMSHAVSVTLGLTYLLSLVFILFTHRHLFVARRDVSEEVIWGKSKSAVILLLATGLAAVESHILIDVLHPLVETAQLHEEFVGLVVIALITNVPEHMAAIGYGLRNNVTLSLEIGMNSAIQIALFVAPILVFVSPLVGSGMTLAFAPFQMVALILTVMIINYISSDGICNWLEGVQLVAVYIIIATAFYFL